MAKKPVSPDRVRTAPFETNDLRRNLAAFLDTPFLDPVSGIERPVGNFRWGVYAFFDYDGEPIYAGQTNEMLRVRIRRHLTNQRTDAVAMSVLDPFEVYRIKVWPLPEFQEVTKNGPNKHRFKDAKAHLNALERVVYEDAVSKSKFNAILNEKNPPLVPTTVAIPPACERVIVSDEVYQIRSHPDFRIYRRALIISRLAQVISEREVRGGLRRVMLTQARRLQWLAERRYKGLGGDATVPVKAEDEEEGDTNGDES